MGRETDAPADEHPVEPDRLRVQKIYNQKAYVDEHVGQEVKPEAWVLQQSVHFGLRPAHVRNPPPLCTGFPAVALKNLSSIVRVPIGTLHSLRTFKSDALADAQQVPITRAFWRTSMGTSEKPKAQVDKELDEALKETFPGSDPIAVDRKPDEPVRPVDRRPPLIDRDLVEKLSEQVKSERVKSK